MSTLPDGLVNLFDFESEAVHHMAPAEYDYVAGGATDEVTLRRTRSAWDAIALRPRVLTGTRAADLSTTVLGHRVPMPVLLAPCGGHRRAHPEGECESARGAAAFGTILGVSANGSVSLEEAARAADAPKWFQMYFYRDREQTLDMLRRAEAAGYSAITITLDANWPAKRERNIRGNYRQSERPNYKGGEPPPVTTAKFDSGQSSRGRVDPGSSWDDIAWLRDQTKLPLIFKGVMTGEDAARCAQHGVDALVVSNHGARNLDTTLATIEVLPEVTAAVDGRLEVYVDGGVRRGTDVLKAIALGARAVLIGRPMFYGLALGGAEGVVQVLDILRDEVESAMMLTGQPSMDAIDRSLIAHMPALG
jgi:4-hydroxymandelate oxidase